MNMEDKIRISNEKYIREYIRKFKAKHSNINFVNVLALRKSYPTLNYLEDNKLSVINSANITIF